MNEEEKKVVELLEHCQNTYIEDTLVTRLQLTTEEAKILLNLIKKQQKEIEELSIIKNSIQTLETHYVNDDTYYVIAKKNFLEGDFRHLLDDYISKDKIKEKIKEVENREENYTFEKLTSEDIRKTIITNLEELLGGTDGKD